MREEDDGGGRPQIIPETMNLDESQLESSAEQVPDFAKPENLKSDSQPLKWANPLAYPATWSLFVLIIGFMTLWVLSQLIQFSRDLLTWPWALRLPALAILAGLMIMIAYHGFRLWQSFRKLKTQRQLSLSDLDELDDRRELQSENLKQYRQQIKVVLKAYDFKDNKLKKKLVDLGFHDRDFLSLEKSKTKLLEAEWPDSQTWLNTYLKEFQSIIDEKAHERIKKTAFRIGLASASCPQKALDVLIVLGGSLQLNADLCMIYRLKLGRIGLMSLLIRSFRNSFIAMNLEDVSDHLMDQWTDQWKEHASGLASYLGKVIGTRLAEGGANALLMYRLGQASKKQLQPLRK
jgi:uncharacterized membrane protein YcjF (UPF0283 family)